MKNKKSIVKILGIVALTAVIAIGGTLAYLSAVTGEKKNTFTSTENNVKGTIKEEKWETTGKDKAEDYMPGDVIAKDPVVALEANSEPAYVGMKLDFIGSNGNKMPYGTAKTDTEAAKGFQAYASHDGIKAGWTVIARNAEGSELYMYDTSVAGGAQTGTIFDTITVNAGITTVTSSQSKKFYTKTTTYDPAGNVINEELTEVVSPTDETTTYYDENGNAVGAAHLPKFEIAATGYAVQSANTSADLAKTEIINLANNGLATTDAGYFVAQ